jgi:hypothetical protein
MKTTFSNLPGFLAAVDNAYRVEQARLAKGLPKGTPVTVPNGTYKTKTGPPITMFFDPLAGGRLSTAYVAGSWF